MQVPFFRKITMRSMSGSENSVFDICFFVSMDGWLVGTSGEVAPGVPGIFRSGWPTEDSVAGIFAVSKDSRTAGIPATDSDSAKTKHPDGMRNLSPVETIPDLLSGNVTAFFR